MPRSIHGGRHELGQNFLTHQPTIRLITSLVARTHGAVLELGAGDGALTRPLAALGRPLTAIDIDEHRAAALARTLKNAKVVRADALQFPFDEPVIVGNIPFHLTTPILRRLLSAHRWRQAVLLTQWEVARKRAGVGGSTMLTAQTAPWFTVDLHGRVPAVGFSPRPSVDGGILQITRLERPLLPSRERPAYERFVRAIFTGRGGTLDRIVANASGTRVQVARRSMHRAGISERSLPRDLTADQWAALWTELNR